MAEATVTSIGQKTIPSDVRKAMGLKAQDRVIFTVLHDGTTVMRDTNVIFPLYRGGRS